MKIEISEIPVIETGVALHGSNKQVEVGGAVCLGFLIGLATMLRD